jgi:hypothetical protein
MDNEGAATTELTRGYAEPFPHRTTPLVPPESRRWGAMTVEFVYIDLAIAPLIEACWEKGIITVTSCQEAAPGLAEIGFATLADMERMYEALNQDGFDDVFDGVDRLRQPGPRTPSSPLPGSSGRPSRSGPGSPVTDPFPLLQDLIRAHSWTPHHKVLTCAPDVEKALQAIPVREMKPPLPADPRAVLNSLLGIVVIVSEDSPPGSWQLVRHDHCEVVEVMREGDGDHWNAGDRMDINKTYVSHKNCTILGRQEGS